MKFVHITSVISGPLFVAAATVHEYNSQRINDFHKVLPSKGTILATFMQYVNDQMPSLILPQIRDP